MERFLKGHFHGLSVNFLFMRVSTMPLFIEMKKMEILKKISYIISPLIVTV